MKNIGITRRIDELGRIVIPKEIRKKLHITAGDLLEINLDDNSIILKKHSVLENEEKFINTFITFFSSVFKTDIYIIDSNKIVFSNNNQLVGKSVTIDMIELSKRAGSLNNMKNIILSEDIIIDNDFKIYPLLPNGDLVGMIIFNSKKTLPGDEILKLCYNFVEKYLEND